MSSNHKQQQLNINKIKQQQKPFKPFFASSSGKKKEECVRVKERKKTL